MVTALLPYVPEIYPDETFYSFFARYRRDLRLSQARACFDFFGKFRPISPVGKQVGLREVAERIHPGRRLTAECLIHKTTPFNYFAAFTDPDEAKFILRRFIAGEIEIFEYSVRMRRWALSPNEHLLLCVECCQQAKADRFDLYWRRSHQLPAVLLCPDHDTILFKSRVPATGSYGHQNTVALSDRIIRNSVPVIDRECPAARGALSELSALSYRLCNGDAEQYSEISVSGHYKSLRELGFIKSNHILSGEITNLFAGFLGPIAPYIPGLCPEEAKIKRMYVMWGAKSKDHHPVRHILFYIFLSHLIEQSIHQLDGNHGFDSGPWPCLNPLADHTGDRRIIQLVLHKQSVGEPNKAVFRCRDCGYTYRREQGSAETEALEFGMLFDDRLIELFTAGATFRTMEIELHVNRERICSEARRLGLPLRLPAARSRTSLSADKAKFEKLREQYPSASRVELRSKDGGLVARLERNAREWLESHQPVRRPGKVRDWQDTDVQLADEMVQRASDRLAQVPTARITKRYLIGERGYFHGIDVRAKLPKCHALILDLVETHEAFYERSLRLAASQLTEAGIPLSVTRMWKLARLSPRAGPIADAIIKASLKPVI